MQGRCRPKHRGAGRERPLRAPASQTRWGFSPSFANSLLPGCRQLPGFDHPPGEVIILWLNRRVAQPLYRNQSSLPPRCARRAALTQGQGQTAPALLSPVILTQVPFPALSAADKLLSACGRVSALHTPGPEEVSCSINSDVLPTPQGADP